MISRKSLVTLGILLAGLIAGYLLSGGLNNYLSISFTKKDLSGTEPPGSVTGRSLPSLPLRMVDLGGVGILPDTVHWGKDYDHNQHVFEDLWMASPPYLDTVVLARELQKLERYSTRMAAWGYNAITLPFFLEFINFEKVGDGYQVYGEGSGYRTRHDSLAAGLRDMIGITEMHGLDPYLWTDMVALTTPLEQYFKRRFGSVDVENEELWNIYELAAEELFEKFPEVEGIVLRIGEAGSIYNQPGWDYRSELYVQTEKAVELMLRSFLRAAEKYDRTIIFRTWSVGVGEIGDMHTQPETYRQILEPIQSDHLVVSTKYCEGDFYSWLPLNQTLLSGSHRRIIEFQAKREFEGFGAILNYLGPMHQAVIQSLVQSNRHVEGAWVWTQYGGPLRAGPLIIYPFYGFNAINDLNVYALARLLKDPGYPVDSITAAWVRGQFGPDSLLADGFTACMNASNGIMQKGLYISQFARYRVKALGLEPPPMLWIFEWDILGASSSVYSNIYFISRDHFQEVVDEGFEAVQGAVALREKLLEIRDRVSQHAEDFDQLIEQAEYEIELFRLLDYYRQYMMHYYRWIDTGDAQQRTAFQLSMGQFRAVADFHQQKFAGNLNTLGLDLEEAMQGVRINENSFASIRWARVWMVLALFLLLMGIPGFIRPRGHRLFAASLFFDTLFRPHLISSLNSYHSRRLVAFLMAMLYLLGLFIFSSFAALRFTAAWSLLALIYCLMLMLMTGRRGADSKAVISLIAPRLIIMALFIVLVAYRGPGYFWYRFWTSDLFRTVFLSLLLMLWARKYQIYVILVGKWSRRNGAGSLAVVLTALGTQLLAAGAMLYFAGMEKSVTLLNNELLILPGGLSKIMGITTHLGIPAQFPDWLMATALALSLLSLILLLLNRRIGHQ